MEILRELRAEVQAVSRIEKDTFYHLMVAAKLSELSLLKDGLHWLVANVMERPSSEDLGNLLDLGVPLSDQSSFGGVKDECGSSLFSISNLLSFTQHVLGLSSLGQHRAITSLERYTEERKRNEILAVYVLP
jgi:hypothetical protein